MSTEEDWVWENHLYFHIGDGFIERAIDEIFWWFNARLQDGEFTRCDEMLKEINISRLDSNTMIAILTVTLTAKESLGERAGFLAKVKDRLIETVPERCESLLKGLA